MDPTTTATNLIEALASGNLNDAEDHFDNLKEWIERGGFKPSVKDVATALRWADVRNRVEEC